MANNPPSGVPVLSDTTPTEGQLVTALTNGITDPDGTTTSVFTFQWQASLDGVTWTNIIGATLADFVPSFEEANQFIRVQVQFTDDLGTVETLFSDPSGIVDGLPVGAPVLSDESPTETVTLTVDTSGITDPNGTTTSVFAIQWQSSSNGSTWTDIAGETATSFTPAQAQVGLFLRAQVSYTDDLGNAATLFAETTLKVGDAITGTNAGQTINGTAGDDLISGLGGNDTLNGLGGDDVLLGGDGNDTLNGGAGFDDLQGGAGNDIYIVTDFGDTITEHAGEGTADEVRTDLDSFGLEAEVEILTYTGSSGFGFFGSGNDSNNIITGGAFNDVLDGGLGADTVNGLAGDDVLLGGDGNDTLNGGAGLDFLIGDVGDDVLNGGADADTMSGGTGDDTYVVDNIGDVVDELPGEGTDTVQSLLNDYTLGADVENLTFIGTGAFIGTGNTADNIITGGAGADTLTGGDGADTINGMGGNDVIDAGIGDDIINIVAGLSGGSINGRADFDTLNILDSGGGDTLTVALDASSVITSVNGASISNVESFNADLGAGDDTLAYTAGSIGVLVDLSGNFASGFDSIAGIENVTGTDDGDLIIGDDNANVLLGAGGNDLLDGGLGNDTVEGGAGNDFLTGGGGADLLNGGIGDDFVDAGDGDDTITYVNGEGVDTIDGGAGTDTVNVVGSASNEVAAFIWDGVNLNGAFSALNVESFTLDLGGGVDRLSYQLSTVAVIVDLANHIASGFDSVLNVEDIRGSTFDDLLIGDAGDNAIVGLGGADTIFGGAGNDTIAGGSGVDTIDAGDGNDTILYVIGQTPDFIDGGAGFDTVAITSAAGVSTRANFLYDGTSLTYPFQSLTNVESVTMDLGDGGNDTLSYQSTHENVTVDLGAGTATGFTSIAGVENIRGAAGADILIGDSHNNNIVGLGGNDMIFGGAGNDVLGGGKGDDFIDGGDGNDLINYNIGQGADTIDGGAGIDTLTIVGSTANNVAAFKFDGVSLTSPLTISNVEIITLDLKAGIDQLSYAANLVSVSVNLAAGTASGFTSIANVENIRGGNASDILTGNAGANEIIGAGGDDIITGGAGTDTLFGGSGSDTFVFTTGSGHDVISDFDADPAGGQDLLDISGYGITSADFAAHVSIALVAGNTVVTIDGTETITLTGVTSGVDSNDFILAP